MTPALWARLRKFWLDVHLWLGAGLVALTIPLGLTGSLLMVRGQLDHALHAERYAVSAGPAALPPSAYIDAAATAFGPQVKPAQLRLPGKAGEPVVVSGRGKPAAPGQRPAMLNAWLDPATARVLDTGPGMDGIVRLAHDVHGHMLIDGWGRKLVGWLGWALLASCLTGLWIWWPRGSWLRGLRWRRTPSTNANLHHLVGFWVLVPLAILSLTGAHISFPRTAALLTGRPQPIQQAGPRFAPPLGKTQLSADQAAAAALASRPGARLASLSLPTRGPSPAWRVELRGAGRPQAVQVADAGGAVSPARQGGGDPFARAVRRVHEGEGWGPLWLAIVFITGLAPALLGVTGVIIWLRKQQRRRAFANGV
jgi:uncharacterized iron-regulated membrane protein